MINRFIFTGSICILGVVSNSILSMHKTPELAWTSFTETVENVQTIAHCGNFNHWTVCSQLILFLLTLTKKNKITHIFGK